jgi:RNA polymerase sigma-70 factor (ECF subfamily)
VAFTLGDDGRGVGRTQVRRGDACRTGLPARHQSLTRACGPGTPENALTGPDRSRAISARAVRERGLDARAWAVGPGAAFCNSVYTKWPPRLLIGVVTRRGATPRQLETLYRQRFQHFVRVATAICGSADSGHDAVQNAFIMALRYRRRYGGSGPLEAWVWRIVVNEARRVGRGSPAVEVEGVPVGATNGADGDGDPFGLRAWIATLPERQREAIFLRYFADLDYRAIADVLDIEVGTVSATLGAAHRTLRKRLEVRQ